MPNKTLTVLNKQDAIACTFFDLKDKEDNTTFQVRIPKESEDHAAWIGLSEGDQLTVSFNAQVEEETQAEEEKAPVEKKPKK